MNSTNSPFEFQRKNRIDEQMNQTIIVWFFFIDSYLKEWKSTTLVH